MCAYSCVVKVGRGLSFSVLFAVKTYENSVVVPDVPTIATSNLPAGLDHSSFNLDSSMLHSPVSISCDFTTDADMAQLWIKRCSNLGPLRGSPVFYHSVMPVL
uniref:Merlin n=1 Tax=Rhipicephalus zambeziensis TaxID=60191 RepID=A0A224YT75_9ACAR